MNRKHVSSRGGFRLVAWVLGMVVVLSGCAGRPAIEPYPAPGVAPSELDAWVDGELAPYLVDQLARHPRFKGEPVLMVRVVGADVQPSIDALTAGVRDRLTDHLLQAPGVNLVWRPASPPPDHHRSLSEVRCQDARRVHYYVGIEAKLTPAGTLQVSVRGLDLREKRWVTGFGKRWEGVARPRERSALRDARADEYLRGLRALPFEAGQSDLLAGYLAHNLSCLLRQRGLQRTVVHTERPSDGSAFMNRTVELMGNYLSRWREVQVSDRVADADLVVSARIHDIDGALHQVWAVTRAPGDGAHASGVDTAAYVQLQRVVPDGVQHSGNPPAPLSGSGPVRSPSPVGEPNPGLIAALRVVTPVHPALCDSPRPWRRGVAVLDAGEGVVPGGCFAVEVDLRQQARVFLVSETSGSAPLRWMPEGCGVDPAAAHGGDRTVFYPPPRGDGPRVLRVGGSPGEEIFYAIAVSDGELAGRLSRRLAHLPDGCRPRNALSAGDARWLADVGALARRHPGAVEWRTVHVRVN